VARRRMAIKRLDPWSVLKFGAVANLVLLAIFLLGTAVVWFIVDRLELVEQACEIAIDVGFTSCAVEASGLFQALLLLGLLWAVVQTAVLVFLAFLHNLIADLTGGIVLGVVDDTPVRTDTGTTRVTQAASSGPVSGPISRPPSPPRTDVSTTQPQRRVTTADGAAVEASHGPDAPARPRNDGDELFAER
jgi:hypothetical protein